MAKTPGPYGPVQVIPPGIVDLLQLKGLGESPGLVTDTFVPTIETRDWLMEPTALIGTSTNVDLAAGTVGFADLPNLAATNFNAIWLQHFSIQCMTLAGAGLPATDNCEFACAMRGPAVANGFVVFGERSGLVQGAAPGRFGSAWSQNFWLPPSHQLGVMVFRLEAAASIRFVGTVRRTSMKV